LDPYPTAPLFVPYPSSDAPAPAPLASTHCRLVVRVAVWRNLPSVASTGPIFRQSKIVTFVATASWCNGRRRCLIEMRRNVRKCNRKQLLDVIYTGVGVGGGVSPSPASASLIFGPNCTPPCSRRGIGGDRTSSCADPSPDLDGRPIAHRYCTPPRQPSPWGDIRSGGGGTSLLSAKIQRFSRSSSLLAPSMRRASRASSSPSPCLRWPPNPLLSAASSRARPPIPTASIVGRLLFFAIPGHHGCCCHRPPRLCLPPSPDPIVPSPPPPAPSLAHPLPLMMRSSLVP
jgi:hypothetical protein